MDLQRHARNGAITCPYRCRVTTPANEEVPKNYALAAAVEAHVRSVAQMNDQRERDDIALLHKCATAAYSLTLADIGKVVEVWGLQDDIDMEAGLSSMRRQVHDFMTALVPQSTLTTVQDMLIRYWMNADNSLRSLYRSTRDGPSYDDLLRCVGNTEELVFVIRANQYLFGAWISAGITLPDEPTAVNTYECDVSHFSLAGHFDTPRRIDVNQTRTGVDVAGRQGAVFGVARLQIGHWDLWLGCGPAADMRSCSQSIDSRYVPEGYRGARDEHDNAVLGGHFSFVADELEVLTFF